MQSAAPLTVEGDSNGFGRELRLLKPGEFKRVFNGATRCTTRYLTLLARSNETGQPRLGMAISRKQIKTAVGRNRVKRQIRESFRHHQQLLGGLDIVVLARGGCDKSDPRKLRAGLDREWSELVKRCARS